MLGAGCAGPVPPRTRGIHTRDAPQPQLRRWLRTGVSLGGCTTKLWRTPFVIQHHHLHKTIRTSCALGSVVLKSALCPLNPPPPVNGDHAALTCGEGHHLTRVWQARAESCSGKRKGKGKGKDPSRSCSNSPCSEPVWAFLDKPTSSPGGSVTPPALLLATGGAGHCLRSCSRGRAAGAFSARTCR